MEAKVSDGIGPSINHLSHFLFNIGGRRPRGDSRQWGGGESSRSPNLSIILSFTNLSLFFSSPLLPLSYFLLPFHSTFSTLFSHCFLSLFLLHFRLLVLQAFVFLNPSTHLCSSASSSFPYYLPPPPFPSRSLSLRSSSS